MKMKTINVETIISGLNSISYFLLQDV